MPFPQELAASRWPEDDDADEMLRAALLHLRTQRLFFAHESVGAGIMEAVGKLALAADHPVKLVELGGPSPIPRGTWAHGRLGGNGDPLRKLERLRRWLELPEARDLDAVLFKLCYADVDATTDVQALHEALRTTFADLQCQLPSTLFALCTVPLTTVQSGARSRLKRLLGRAPGGLRENARRHQLNELLRAGDWPLFDLARLESLDADGRLSTIAMGAQQIPELARSNTGDGGHLEDAAAIRIGRALIGFMADLGSTPRAR